MALTTAPGKREDGQRQERTRHQEEGEQRLRMEIKARKNSGPSPGNPRVESKSKLGLTPEQRVEVKAWRDSGPSPGNPRVESNSKHGRMEEGDRKLGEGSSDKGCGL